MTVRERSLPESLLGEQPPHQRCVMSTSESGAAGDGAVQLTVRWSGQELQLHLLATDTVADLRDALCVRTRVLPARQKLLNLRVAGRPAPDSAELGALALKPGAKIMMMGSPEEEIAAANEVPEEAAGVLDDFFEEEGEVPLHLRPENVAKVGSTGADCAIGYDGVLWVLIRFFFLECPGIYQNR